MNHRLPRASAELEAILDGLDDAIYVLDRQLRPTYANSAARRFLGLDAGEDPQAAPATDLFDGMDVFDEAGTELDRELLPVRRALRGEPVEPMTIRYRQRSTGVEGWAELRVVPVGGPPDAPRSVALIANDLTGRKRAEGVLRKELDVARAILRSSPNPVGRTDMAGRLVDWNEAMEELAGASPGDAVHGTSLVDLLPAAERPRAAEQLRDTLRTGRAGPTEYVVDCRGAGERVLSVSSALAHDSDGVPIGAVSVVQDVTRSKEVEEELRRLSEGLRHELEKERTRIAREIHDELGQRLTALKMELGFARGAGEEHGRLVSAMRLVDELTATVRRIATELRPSVLDHLGLAAAIEWQAEELQKRTGIECRFHVQGEEPELSPDAATALFRAMQEALTNVTRHAQATQVDVTLRAREDLVTVEVQDNGIGFDPASTAALGSLGLLGMRERLGVAGGLVRLESRPGAGTRVVAELPLKRSAVGGN